MPRVTQKGQVTIPQRIRLALGISAGDEVTFTWEGGEVLIKKEMKSVQNLRKYVGHLSHLQGKDSDQIVNELRGDESADRS